MDLLTVLGSVAPVLAAVIGVVDAQLRVRRDRARSVPPPPPTAGPAGDE